MCTKTPFILNPAGQTHSNLHASICFNNLAPNMQKPGTPKCTHFGPHRSHPYANRGVGAHNSPTPPHPSPNSANQPHSNLHQSISNSIKMNKNQQNGRFHQIEFPASPLTPPSTPPLCQQALTHPGGGLSSKCPKSPTQPHLSPTPPNISLSNLHQMSYNFAYINILQ